MDSVIQGRGLTKTYGEEVEVHALRGVDLQIARGSFVAIMGPSGSGKSTLLNILGALEVPTSGELLIDGTSVGTWPTTSGRCFAGGGSDSCFSNSICCRFSRPSRTWPCRCGWKGSPRPKPAERAAKMLDVVGLAERGDHLPSQLSGGEQQRVAMARALVTNPAIILADEPTGNLDSANGDQVIGMLRDLVDRRGQTVVLVTHDAAVASRSDRVINVRDGRIVGDHDPRHESFAEAGAEPRL